MRQLPMLVGLLALLSGTPRAETMLNGAGSTFIYPLMSKWAEEYHRLHPSILINYHPVGSGGGIYQVSEGLLDFGASDGPMTDEQIARVQGGILHIPVALGAVVPAYNIPNVAKELRFTPQILVDIFLGKIVRWNDPALAAVSPGVSLPDLAITVIHRSDASGTTYVWTDYLSKVSPEWQLKAGKNISIHWPVGLEAQGNEGVAETLRQTAGSVGYLELTYAQQHKILFGAVQNASGAFVKASTTSTTAAAASIRNMPGDFRLSITNPPGRDAYPIASFTWVLLPNKNRDPNIRTQLKQFVSWTLTEGQKLNEGLWYSMLPKNIAERAKDAVEHAP